MRREVLNSFNNLFKSFTQTIGYVIFKKIFLGYLAIIVIISIYQSLEEIGQTKKAIKKNIITIEKVFANHLTDAIRDNDSLEISKVLNSITKDDLISGILVSTKGKTTYFPSDKTYYDPTIYDEHKFKLYENPYFQTGYVADIIFYTNNHIVKERAYKQIKQIVIYLCIFTLLFWALITYYTNRFLTQPLRKLIEGVKEFENHDEQKSHIKLELNNSMELSILADSFNKMSGKISEDIINLKQLTMIQNLQKKALEDANRAKDDFLANMSHELKTPLNSINLISSIMRKNKEGRFNEKEVKNLEIINNCGYDLLFLINDVLDISKLEAGKLQLYYEPVNTKKIMHEIKDMFEPQVVEKNISFEFRYDENIEAIYSDKQRVKQIIKNLISNSLKFVESGGIRFFVEDQDEFVKVTISDDGIGIAEDKLETIFDRFKQADGSTTRKYGGTGLGLAICKELTDLFKGDLKIESTIDVGTTVTLLIPKNLDKLNSAKIEETEKEEIEEKSTKEQEKSQAQPQKEQKDDNTILFGDDEEEGKSSCNILILNKDPINYMGLIIELNKLCSVQQASSLKDFKERLKKDEFKLLIVDMECVSKEQIDEFFLKIPQKVLFVSKETPEKSEGMSVILKPFDKVETINIIKKEAAF